jgi:hypothetical protein
MIGNGNKKPSANGVRMGQSEERATVVQTTNLPEILNHLVFRNIASVVGVLLPVVDVNVRESTDQKLVKQQRAWSVICQKDSDRDRLTSSSRSSKIESASGLTIS